MSRINSKKIRKWLGMVAFAIVAGAWLTFQTQAAPETKASIKYLDVGQGDSELITLESDYQIMIDGGPGDQVIDQLNLNMPAGDRTIEMMFLTHPDADHLAGLISVIAEYDVKQIFMPDVAKDTRMYKEWMELIAQKQISYQRLREPQTLNLPGGAILTILHPSTPTMLPRMEANDWSVVMRLDINHTTFLFTGDMEQNVEASLVAHYPTQLKATVLKVPHHGSHTSSTSDFLRAVQPALAIMEVGKDNRYGHPHREVVQRYGYLKIPVLRTDQEGTITLDTDGESIWREHPMIASLGFVGKKYDKVYTFEQR